MQLLSSFKLRVVLAGATRDYLEDSPKRPSELYFTHYNSTIYHLTVSSRSHLKHIVYTGVSYITVFSVPHIIIFSLLGVSANRHEKKHKIKKMRTDGTKQTTGPSLCKRYYTPSHRKTLGNSQQIPGATNNSAAALLFRLNFSLNLYNVK
jgi:hypothetical protein